MAIAYRAGTTAGNASGTDLAINKPTGTADGDILLVVLYREAGTWTLPAGWTQIADQANWNATLTLTMAWKRASSEGASYTFNLSATTWRIAAMAAFSGCLASGDPVDVYAANGAAEFDEIPDASSITTTVADTMRVCGVGNYTGADVGVGSSGFTQGAALGGTELFYATQAGAGASGVKTFATIASDLWCTVHLALKPASGSLSATANQTTETDTAQAVSKLKTKAAGQLTETDTAQAVAKLKTAAIGQPAETDTVQAITALKTVAIGQVSETDAAQPLAGLKTLAVGQTEETDSPQAIGRVKALAIGQTEETDAGQAVGRLKTVAVGQAGETDTAQAITVTGGISQAVGQATETDSPQAITRLKTLAIGQVSEADLAISMVVVAGAVAIYAASLNSNPSPAGTLNSNPSPVTTQQGNPSPVASLNSNPSPVGELDSNPSPVEELVIG